VNSLSSPKITKMVATGRNTASERYMEIRVSVDDKSAEQLQEKLGTTKATDIAKSALTLLNWAVNEVANGRVILSSDSDGENLHRLVMPELEVARLLASKDIAQKTIKNWIKKPESLKSMPEPQWLQLKEELEEGIVEGGYAERLSAKRRRGFRAPK
jgi:hypothetical protein